MLTKSEKIVMYVIGLSAIVLSVVCCIPFRTLASSAACFTAETIVKFIVFPILILGSVVYPCILKYKEICKGGERRTIINVMCYLPIVVYLISILVFALHTLTFKLSPMSESAHSVLVVMCAVYAAMLVCLVSKINKIVMSFTKVGNMCFDGAVVILMVVFILLSWRVGSAYSNAFANVEGFIYGKSNDDPFLFFLYLIMLCAVCAYVVKFVKFIKSEESIKFVASPELEAEAEVVEEDETLEEAEMVEEVGETLVGSESVTEKVEEVKYDGSNPRLQGDSDKKQQALKEMEELNEQLVKTDSLNDEKMAAEVQALKDKIASSKQSLDQERSELEQVKQALEASIQALQARVAELAPAEEEPVEVVKEPVKKVLKPSVDQIMEFAESLKEEDWVVKGALEDSLGTVKFYKGKVLFLIIQGTKNDYRITFLATQKKWSSLLKSSKSITFPKNAKGPKWLKFVNKGVVPAGQVKGLVREAVKGVYEEIADIQKAKEEEKARKLAEKKALKDAEKQAKLEAQAASEN